MASSKARRRPCRWKSSRSNPHTFRCFTPETRSTPADLARHACITIRQGDEAYGLWRLTGRGRQATPQAVKVRGPLSTNDGGIAVSWALEGHGILMRAQWDIQRHLATGRLVQVLPQFDTPDADLYAVWPQAHQGSRRVRTFVEFVADAFAG